MFSFFNKTNIINIDCFTYYDSILRFVPIKSALESKPKWFYSLEKTKIGKTRQESKVTLRTCNGFLELYKRGFFLDHWCDLNLIVEDNGGYTYNYSFAIEPQIHGDNQFSPGFNDTNVLKLTSPWCVKTKEDVSFLMFGAEWNLNDCNIKILPGILNFSRDYATNVFITFKKKRQEFEIPVGQTLSQFIPLNDKRVKIHNHLISKEEWDSFQRGSTISFYGWRRMYPLLRRKNKMEKKCPFSF